MNEGVEKEQPRHLNLKITPEELKTAESYLSLVDAHIDKYPAIGMVFSHVLPLQLDSKSTIVFKKPRHAEIEVVEKDILGHEGELIDKGVFNFAPSVRIEKYMLQRFIKGRQPNPVESRKAFDELSKKRVSLSNIGENIIITPEGGFVIIDVLNAR